MFRALLSLESFHLWPSISLVVCTAFMLGTIAWMFRPGAKQKYEFMAQLILVTQSHNAADEGDISYDR